MIERYYVLRPEVAGGLGSDTVPDRSSHPPIVRSLHYQFDGWLGDELIESFPCFLVTERVADALRRSGFSSFDVSDASITQSEQFEELYPSRRLPKFVWFRPNGTPGKDPIAIGPDASLVVSAGALALLKSFALTHCETEPWPPN